MVCWRLASSITSKLVPNSRFSNVPVGEFRMRVLHVECARTFPCGLRAKDGHNVIVEPCIPETPAVELGGKFIAED